MSGDVGANRRTFSELVGKLEWKRKMNLIDLFPLLFALTIGWLLAGLFERAFGTTGWFIGLVVGAGGTFWLLWLCWGFRRASHAETILPSRSGPAIEKSKRYFTAVCLYSCLLLLFASAICSRFRVMHGAEILGLIGLFCFIIGFVVNAVAAASCIP